MPRRKETETVQIGLRVKEALRAALDEASKQHGISMNAEIVRRLERSFSEAQAFGSPELQRLAYFMASAFAMAADHSAGDRRDWFKDRDAYSAGMLGVLDALLIGLPDGTDEHAALMIEALKGRLLSRIMARKLEEQDK